jgi:hypothetical protein
MLATNHRATGASDVGLVRGRLTERWSIRDAAVTHHGDLPRQAVVVICRGRPSW